MEPDETREPVTKEVRLLVPIEKNQAEAKRVTYGVVLEPDSEDLQGDVMTAEDIETAAYDWMERSQAGGHMHSQRIEGAKVVESYIAPCDIPVETPTGRETIRKGSWVLAMRWPEEVWEGIAKGALTGYSVGGTGVRLALEEIGKKGKWAPGPNAGWRLASGDPAREGAAAEGGGTPADRGAAAAREEDREREQQRSRSKPEGGEPKVGDKVTFQDGVEAKVVGVSRDHILVEGPGVPNGTMAVGYDDLDSDGNIKFDAEYKPKYRGEYERPSAYGGGLEEQDDDKRDGYPSGTVDDEDRYPKGGKWPGEDDYVSDAEREEAEWKAGYGQDASQGWEAEAGYKTFTRGQKVRTPTGKVRTVLSQRGSMVFVEEESNGWYHPEKLYPVEKSLAEVVAEALEEVAKAGGWAPGPNAGWRRIYESFPEHGATMIDGPPGGKEPKKHTTRDGVVIEDQPKVTRVGGEQYQVATPKGQVILNFGEWKWTGSGKSPKVTERGSWAVWPRHKKHNGDNLIQSSNRTIGELMRDLPPGEYDLAP